MLTLLLLGMTSNSWRRKEDDGTVVEEEDVPAAELDVAGPIDGV